MAEFTPLQRLRTQLLQRWQHFPVEHSVALDTELQSALEQAAAAKPEVITVMNPTSRPQRLRLAVLVSDTALDSLYHREWAELAVSDKGVLYLVYRRSDGGDYAVEWSSATPIPTSMLDHLSESLALALFEQDDSDHD